MNEKLITPSKCIVNMDINKTFYAKRFTNKCNNKIKFIIPSDDSRGDEYQEVLNFLSHHGNRRGFTWIIEETTRLKSGEVSFTV